MRAFHCASTDVQRRANELVDAERLTSDRCANDIDDRIYRSDLVKVDRLDWHIVNTSFSLAEKFECSNGHFSRGSSDVRFTDDVLDC